MFIAAVPELSVLLLLQHGHALAIFRKERRTHATLLYLLHSLAGVGLIRSSINDTGKRTTQF